jgi:hypothetical protein
MSETEKKPRKRQPKQTTPALVESTETSGVDLIYPPSLTIGDTTDGHRKPLDDLVIAPTADNTLVALVHDKNSNTLQTNHVVEEEPKESPYKMDRLTQIYVGSLTVVGLFVFYRLLTRKR